jgi:hypothetical protein
MSSDSDLFVDDHDLWTRIKLKFFKSTCTAYAPSIAWATNLSKGEEQERWQPNDESTSSIGSSPTSYKCLVANNDSGDESDDEEEHDYSEDESTLLEGTFSWIASGNVDDKENDTVDVGEEEIRQFYTNLNKGDNMILMKLLRRNKEQGESLLRLEEILIKTNSRLKKMTKEHEELRCSHVDLVQRYDSVLIEKKIMMVLCFVLLNLKLKMPCLRVK